MELVPESEFLIQDCRFTVRDGTNDRDVVRSIFEGEYAVPDVREYQHCSTSLDIGAHIGAYSVWACLTYPVLNVLGVEPLMENMKLLDANRKANILEKRMRAMQRAVGAAKEKFAKIGYGDPETVVGKMHMFVGNAARAGENRQVVEIPIISLAQIMAQAKTLFGCAKFWTMKLDCEGAEAALLAEANDADLRKIKWVVGEHHDTEAIVRERLEGLSFVARAMAANQNKDLFCYENPADFRKM